MRSGGQRYRRRRPLPALLLVLVLGVAATIVWFKVMRADDEVTGAAHCDPPAVKSSATTPAQPAPTLGKALEPDALDRTDPEAPANVLVKVINASTQRGQARLVTENLKALGFTQIAEPGNDAIYGEGDEMTCRAQIRFGAQGTAAARTLSLVEPCAELVRDNRQDATVDIAIGDKFDDLHPNRSAKTVLEQLTDFAKQAPAQGGLQNAKPSDQIDSQLLTAARNVRC